MTHTLTNQINSTIKPQIIYGRRGELVRLISSDGKVAIVETEKGDRFACQVDDLKLKPCVDTKK